MGGWGSTDRGTRNGNQGYRFGLALTYGQRPPIIKYAAIDDRGRVQVMFFLLLLLKYSLLLIFHTVSVLVTLLHESSLSWRNPLFIVQSRALSTNMRIFNATAILALFALKSVLTSGSLQARQVPIAKYTLSGYSTTGTPYPYYNISVPEYGVTMPISSSSPT